MSTIIETTTGDITIILKAYHDCDNVQLFWRIKVSNDFDVEIENCLGFAIFRQRLVNSQWEDVEILRNRVGFKNNINSVDVDDLNTLTNKSTIWPFQRYDWTDHGATNNETVRYRVAAMKNNVNGIIGTDELVEIANSGWTDGILVNANCDNGISVFFNRGVVMSQYVARIARKNNWKATDIKNHVAEIEEPLRMFLSGALRKAMISLLDEVIANPFYSIYAALYELDDIELISKLKLLKNRANIILSDGSNTKKDANGKTVYYDENLDIRNELKAAGLNIFDRILQSQGLGHNKFLIVYNTNLRKPVKAWTGSTNWTSTGLCTQLNNGVLIEDESVANEYYSQWNNLQQAGSSFPKQLTDANNKSPKIQSNIDIWFSRLGKPEHAELPIDLAGLKELVDNAKNVILYVMFQPGKEPLTSIINRLDDPNLYIKGIVSTLLPTIAEGFDLTAAGVIKRYQTALIQPEGVQKDFSYWIKEVTRSEFLSYNKPGIGYAITHTKMIVIDPFDDDCKVITGSHNFSNSASQQNDENFIVVNGNKEMAEQYSVACLSIYNHYRWRAYIKEKLDAGENIWSNLSDTPDWQSYYLTDSIKKQIAVWCQ